MHTAQVQMTNLAPAAGNSSSAGSTDAVSAGKQADQQAPAMANGHLSSDGMRQRGSAVAFES